MIPPIHARAAKNEVGGVLPSVDSTGRRRHANSLCPYIEGQKHPRRSLSPLTIAT
jgi:hypothetical protein